MGHRLGEPDCAGAWHLFDRLDRRQSQTVKASIANVDPTLKVKKKRYPRRPTEMNLGSGNAILQTRPRRKGVDDVAGLYGDVPLVRPQTLVAMMDLHRQRGACITLLTAVPPSPDGLGRVIRGNSGSVTAVTKRSSAV